VEFVPANDPMFVELLKRRVGPMEAPTLEAFKDEMAKDFELLREESVPGAERTLLFLELRAANG